MASADASAKASDRVTTRLLRRLEHLRAALRDPDSGVRTAVARALERVESREDVACLVERLSSEDKLTRLNAVYGLGAVGDETALRALVSALRDPVEDIRAAAVRTLGELRAPVTLDPLMERLDDESGLVRRQAIEAPADHDEIRSPDGDDRQGKQQMGPGHAVTRAPASGAAS